MDFQIDKIYNEDCLEGMKRIADGAVDCIITDLPYGTTACAWDSVIPFEPLWEQFKRVTKPNAAIVLFSKQPFTSKLILSNLDMYRYEIIWEKSRVGNSMQIKNQPASIHENIEVFYREYPTYNEQKFKVDERYIDKRKSVNDSFYKSEHYSGVMKREADTGWRHPQSILPFNSVWEEGMHPTQKPVDLLRYLILTYSNEGDTILDATIGSGTTAVAALMEKRHFIGFETNKEYFDIAQGRIDQVLRNPKLF